MKYSLTKLITLFVASLFFYVPTASANKLERMAQRLGLSAAQKAKIKQITYAARRKQIPLKANLQLARLDLHQLVSQHRPDETKVAAAIDKVAKHELAMKKSRILMMVRIKAVLTAKQAAKLSAIQSRRRARRKRLRQRWRRMRRRWRRGGGAGGPGGGNGGGK